MTTFTDLSLSPPSMYVATETLNPVKTDRASLQVMLNERVSERSLSSVSVDPPNPLQRKRHDTTRENAEPNRPNPRPTPRHSSQRLPNRHATSNKRHYEDPDFSRNALINLSSSSNCPFFLFILCNRTRLYSGLGSNSPLRNATSDLLRDPMLLKTVTTFIFVLRYYIL